MWDLIVSVPDRYLPFYFPTFCPVPMFGIFVVLYDYWIWNE